MIGPGCCPLVFVVGWYVSGLGLPTPTRLAGLSPTLRITGGAATLLQMVQSGHIVYIWASHAAIGQWGWVHGQMRGLKQRLDSIRLTADGVAPLIYCASPHVRHGWAPSALRTRAVVSWWRQMAS